MSLRNSLFWAHLTIGIIIGTVLFIIASTGMILAFRPQIVALSERDIYRLETPSSPQGHLNLQDLLDQIRVTYPDTHPTGITLNADPHAPLVVRMGENDALYVNPYTGVILGHGSQVRHWMENVEYWHRWLGLKAGLKNTGGAVKRAVNMAFFFMIVTGLYLWWPRNWTANVLKAVTQFNFSLKGHARDWNWHNVIGLWCAPFLLIISLTGLIMSYPWANNLLYEMTGNKPPVMNQEKQAGGHHRHRDGDADDDEDQPATVGLDALFARAQQQVADWKTITLKLSRHPAAPAVFTIEDPGVGHRSQLTLDSADAQVIKWEPYSSQNSGRKLRTLVRYIHTGEAGGGIGQAIVFLAAGGLLMLIWTGFCMAWRRFFQK